MTSGTLLSVLIIGGAVASMPIGAIRGGLREALFAASVLFGGVLASMKAASWGDRLAESFDVQVEWARFEAAIGVLIGSSLLLGLMGGALCDRRLPSLGGRALGAGLAAGNTLLLFSSGLQSYERFYREGVRQSPIEDSWVAVALIDRFDDLLLVGGASLAACILVGHGLHRIIGVGYNTDLEPAVTWVQQSQRRSRSVRIPVSADEGKIEPEDDAATERPLPPVPAPRLRRTATAFESGDGLTSAEGPPRSYFSEDRRVPSRGATSDDRPDPGFDRSFLDQWLHAPTSRRMDAGNSGDLDRGPELSNAELRRILNMPLEDDESKSSPLRGDREGRCPRCRSWLSDTSLPCPFCRDR